MKRKSRGGAEAALAASRKMRRTLTTNAEKKDGNKQ